jgi:N-methylhydantoinase A
LKQAYLDRFAIDLSNFRPKLINLRTYVLGRREPLDLKQIFSAAAKKATAEEAIIGERDVWFHDEWVKTPIYARDSLPVGATITGPAIFNQMDTTTIAEPGNRIVVDEIGNLIIEVK